MFLAMLLLALLLLPVLLQQALQLAALLELLEPLKDGRRVVTLPVLHYVQRVLTLCQLIPELPLKPLLLVLELGCHVGRLSDIE